MPHSPHRSAWLPTLTAAGFGLLAGLHLAMVATGTRGMVAWGTGAAAIAVLVGFIVSLRSGGDRKGTAEPRSMPTEFLPQLLESIPDPAFIKDRDHRWILVNGAACEMLGLERTDIEGKLDTQIFPSDLAEAFAESDDEAIRTRVSVKRRWKLDRERGALPIASGAPRILEGSTHKKALSGPDGQVLIVGIVRDLTDSAAVEHRLREQRDQARLRANTTDEILSTLGHEIRNPLQAMLGASEMLRMELLPPSAAETAHVLHRAGENLLKLVDDILELSRLEAGAATPKEAPLDLRAVVEETAALFLPLVRSRGGTLETSLPDQPLAILGDETRIRQILSNLVNNAVRYAGHTPILIRLRLDPQGWEDRLVAVIQVVDQGPGFAPEEGPELFRKWHRGAVRQMGSGLGLSIAHHNALLLGGSIAAEGELGKGATFTVNLPIKPLPGIFASLPSPDTGPSIPATSPLDPAAPVLKVLVAEDNRTNQLVLRRQLEKLGCQAHLVDDGSQALDRLRAESFDLVLMDCQMPVMDGFEATRRWREEEASRGISRTPILAVTALTLQAERGECLACGMDAVLTKPLRQAELDGALRTWGRTRI
jgi:PAS domain S-box-containing protein